MEKDTIEDSGKKIGDAKETVNGSLGKYLVNVKDFPNKFNTMCRPHYGYGKLTMDSSPITFDNNVMIVQKCHRQVSQEVANKSSKRTRCEYLCFTQHSLPLRTTS